MMSTMMTRMMNGWMWFDRWLVLSPSHSQAEVETETERRGSKNDASRERGRDCDESNRDMCVCKLNKLDPEGCIVMGFVVPSLFFSFLFFCWLVESHSPYRMERRIEGRFHLLSAFLQTRRNY